MLKRLINSERISDYWRNVDKNILFSFLTLFFLGIFFSFSSTSSLAGERLNKDFYHYFSRHLIISILDILVMFYISYIKISFLKKLILPIFVISLILLMLVPLIGVEIKGAKRWLDLHIFRLQPIELIKPFFVLITANIIASGKDKNLKYSYFISLMLLSAIIILLLNQPDVGQSILLITTWVSIVFISGIKISYIFILLGLLIICAISLLIIFPEKFGYIIQRLNIFFDPAQGDNFQTDKALAAIKQGGLKGQGMGEGILKESVPEAHTDYIIAVISEEFGSIISIMVVTIFLYISYKIIKDCFKTSDESSKIALCGLSSLLIFQTFIHVGVNTSLLPTTGMTLPFLSYGGSSLIGSSILAGVILNITKKRFEDE
jgi:cell division protein FtsW